MPVLLLVPVVLVLLAKRHTRAASVRAMVRAMRGAGDWRTARTCCNIVALIAGCGGCATRAGRQIVFPPHPDRSPHARRSRSVVVAQL